MALTIFPNGLGESLADSLVVNGSFYTTGDVWYVHHTGTDAASPAGQNRARPLETIEQAISNSEDGDVIVVMDGHTEELSGPVSITKRLVIAGGGSSDGKPTAKFSMNSAAAVMFDISGDDIEMRNLYFEENVQTNSIQRVGVSGNRFKMKGCYFECGSNDAAAAVEIESGLSGVEFDSCTWESTAPSGEDQPFAAIIFDGANHTRPRLVDCTVDGGEIGFSNYWAIDGDGCAVTDIRIENISLLRGADIRFSSSTTGFVAGTGATESALIKFDGEAEPEA